MHFLSRSLILGALIACSSPTETPQPLDGLWKLESASPGVPPRTMTLQQRGSTISGTGRAMGVDRDIPIAISGSYSASTAVSPPLVALIFNFENGGGLTAQFNGTLQGDEQISGTVVYYGITNVPQTGTLEFSR